jgi:hypothetical protein
VALPEYRERFEDLWRRLVRLHDHGLTAAATAGATGRPNGSEER